MEILWFATIGLLAGTIATQSWRQSGLGLIGDILFGIAGAVFAGYLFDRLGLFAAGGMLGSLVFAAIGAATLLLLLRIVYDGH